MSELEEKVASLEKELIEVGNAVARLCKTHKGVSFESRDKKAWENRFAELAKENARDPTLKDRKKWTL